MHALICAAAGLTVSLGAVSAADAQTRPADPVGGGVPIHQFEVMEGLTGYTSARTWTNVREVSSGEAFTAAMTAFDDPVTTGSFLDDFPDNFLFGSGSQDAGAHLFTGAGTKVFANQQPPNDKVIVASFTTDSSDYLPSGNNFGPGGEFLSILQFEVGTGNAGVDPISYAGFSPSDVIKMEFALFADGALLAVFDTTAGVDLSGGLAGGAGVSGADGVGIDEVQMIFTVVPSPGAASVFGLAGLAAIRRRR